MIKNTIQIYGLPRSGTNYLEYLMLNNLKVSYERIFVVSQNRKEFNFEKKIALKHLIPKRKYSAYYLIIYKSPKKWLNSFYNYNNKQLLYNDPKIAATLYNNYMEAYLFFLKKYPNRTCLINHSLLLGNEKKFFIFLKKKFKIGWKQKHIITPKGYMNKDLTYDPSKGFNPNNDYIEVDDRLIDYNLYQEIIGYSWNFLS